MGVSLLGKPVTHFIFKSRSVYFGQKRWSRGVTKVIKNVFVPGYKYQNIRGRHKCTRGLVKRKSLRRGHLVDTVLQEWANGKPLRCRIKEPKAVVSYFNQCGWVPISSQLVVAWPEARIATKLDLVLHDPILDKVIVVEIKTGCHYRRCSTSTGTIKHMGPTAISDAPLHQHQLQALIGKQLLLKTYALDQIQSVEALLLYVSVDGEVEVFREPDFQVKYSDKIDQALLRSA
jgi:hypothetical protein